MFNHCKYESRRLFTLIYIWCPVYTSTEETVEFFQDFPGPSSKFPVPKTFSRTFLVLEILQRIPGLLRRRENPEGQTSTKPYETRWRCAYLAAGATSTCTTVRMSVSLTDCLMLLRPSKYIVNNINYSLDNQNNILCYRRFDFTSDVKSQGHWSRIRQIWQTHKGGDMNQEDRQHESRRGELPTEPRVGQVLTYWWLPREVSPDEDFRREVETSITKYVILVV